MTLWRPDPAELADFLRRRGLRVGVGEMLRAIGVLDRLVALGRGPATPREAARFLAPLLCSSLRHQEALPGWLDEFERWSKRTGPEPTPSPRDPPEQPRTPPPSRDILVTVCIVLAVVLLAAIFLRDGSIGIDHSSGRATIGAALMRWASGSRVILSVAPLLLIPPLLAAAYLFWRGPRFPVMQRGPYAGGPLGRLKTGGAGEIGLFAGEAVRDAIRGLRTHRRVQSRRIDPRATVRATVQRAGLPALVTAQSNRAPEYPVLVHAISDRDHLVFLAQSLCIRLQEEGVHHVLYRFSADPRFVWDTGGATASLADIAARFGADVLLLVGDGSPFVDPVTLKLYPWTEAFTEWRVMVLLTPLPRARWSWRERRLAESGVVVLPATSEGLSRLGDFLVSGGRPPRLPLQRRPASTGLLTREGIHAHRFHSDAIPNPAESEEILDAIVQDVPRAAMEVLAVAALFPEARPDLTHYLGQNVTTSLGAKFGDEEGFGALCTLPWMRYGRLPDWLRLALVKTLGPEREAESRRLLPAWVGSEPDETGAVVAGLPGGRPAPEDIQDVIYLRLLRNEPLGTLELRALGDLERFADPAAIPRRWRIAAYVGLADAALVALALLTPVMHTANAFLPEWLLVAGLMAIAASAISGGMRIVTASASAERYFGLASLLLAAAGLIALAPAWAGRLPDWQNVGVLSGVTLGPIFCFVKKESTAPPRAPAFGPISPALAVVWFILLTSIAELASGSEFLDLNAATLALMVALMAIGAIVVNGGSTIASATSWTRQLVASLVGPAAGFQLVLLSFGILNLSRTGREQPVVTALLPLLAVLPLLWVFALFCCFVVTTGRIGPAARRSLVVALVSVVLGTLASMAARVVADRATANAAGIALSTIGFIRLTGFPLRAERHVVVTTAAAIAFVVALLAVVSLSPDAMHPLILVAGVAGMYLVVLRTRPSPQSVAIFAMWFVTLDWYGGWIEPTGLGLVLQPLYLVAAAACGIRFGMSGLPAVLLGGIPLLLYLDVPLWQLHGRGNIDLLSAGLLAFASATALDRPQWLSALQRCGIATLALASLLTAGGVLAVAASLFEFADLNGVVPAIFILTHAALTMLVAATSPDLRRWIVVVVPGPVAVAVAVVLLRHAVPAGPDWSLRALLLAPFWLLVAGSMLAASLRREPTPATIVSTAIYLGELAILVFLLRANYVTSGAMFALIGVLTVDQARRARAGKRVVWAGWAVPGIGGVANAVIVALCITFLSGLRWEGAAAFAVALTAALTTKQAVVTAPLGSGGSRLERLAAAGAVLLPSTLADLIAGWTTPDAETLAKPPAPASSAKAAGPVVLWVDDHPENNLAEQKTLEAGGIAVVLLKTTVDALAWLAENRCDCIVSDMGRREGPREGYALLDALRARGDNIPLFFYATSRSSEHRQETLDHGGQGCTNDPEELLAMINSVLQDA